MVLFFFFFFFGRVLELFRIISPLNVKQHETVKFSNRITALIYGLIEVGELIFFRNTIFLSKIQLWNTVLKLSKLACLSIKTANFCVHFSHFCPPPDRIFLARLYPSKMLILAPPLPQINLTIALTVILLETFLLYKIESYLWAMLWCDTLGKRVT